MTKILLIEDDHSLGPTLKKTLGQEGYEVKLCKNIAEAQEEDFQDYSLVLLDWMLPDGQGIDLLKHISGPPIIMLTARTDVIDKVLGLETGADDYITKPFEPRELLARIRVQLRKSHKKQSTQTTQEVLSSHLKFNLDERRIYYKDQEINLTKMEFDLLYLLATHPKQVFTREKLLDEVWGYDNYPTTRTVDTHVLQLRQKFSNDIIDTVRGIGYRFNPEHN
ncbi:MAG: response regulator transcription factor [Bacteriovoracaceae bacterium]|jgi:DNA-binding response OmpR family regulator|nr:DNA-binding response regulator [Halobacteriovoraceae bacterium]MDP7320022.1 response regulator transcription factor [Bacteriovoracaceae bacterium]|tara:strand:- start:976 stop:1641 length:666 start_codon:yes stop_codon:yes gene_type:complete